MALPLKAVQECPDEATGRFKHFELACLAMGSTEACAVLHAHFHLDLLRFHVAWTRSIKVVETRPALRGSVFVNCIVGEMLRV